MKKVISNALRKLGCTFRDCPKCTEVIDVRVVDGNLIFTDSWGEDKNLGAMDNDLSGTLIGSSNTIAGIPSVDTDGNPIYAGDWAILTEQDGGNKPGVYIYDGTNWLIAKPLEGLKLATDAEFNDKTSTTKAISVAQAWSLPTGYLEKVQDNNLDESGYRIRETGVTGKTTTGLLAVDLSSSGDAQEPRGAIGDFSFATGSNTKALGLGATAMGMNTEASGSNSISMGSLSEASGRDSMAVGNRTLAGELYMTAFGIANVSSAGMLLAVGNGTGDATRSNAFDVFSDGTASLPSSSIADINARGDKAVVTVEYLMSIING